MLFLSLVCFSLYQMTVSVHEVRPPTEGKKQVLCPVDYKVSLSFPSASFAFRSSFPRNELGFTLPEKVFRLNTGDPEIILKEVQALWVVERFFFLHLFLFLQTYSLAMFSLRVTKFIKRVHCFFWPVGLNRAH